MKLREMHAAHPPTSDPAFHGCIGKVGFKTWKLASDVSRQRNRASRSKGEPYHCPSCRDWHIGRKRSTKMAGKS